MEVGIRVEAQNIQKRTVRHTNSCYFTMVAVDEHGKPREVPKLNLDTEWKRCRFEAAEHRKVLRLQENHNPSCSMYKENFLKRSNRSMVRSFSSPKFNVLFRFSKIISELGGECRDN